MCEEAILFELFVGWAAQSQSESIDDFLSPDVVAAKAHAGVRAAVEELFGG